MTEQTPTPWYEQHVRALVESQARNAASHDAIARHFRAMAEHFTMVAEQHEALARSVPDGDQAAADLGTATDRHDLNNLRQQFVSERHFNQDRDQQVARLAADIVTMAARVQALAGRVQALAVDPVLPGPPAEDRDHGHDEMGAP